MTTTAPTPFDLLHSIRIKGLAPDAVLAEMVGAGAEELPSLLAPLIDDGLVVRREGRMSGTMLTPVGKERHAEQLAAGKPTGAAEAAVEAFYAAFLPLNGAFKRICSAWQMRDETTPNDHSDSQYDGAVIGDLAATNDEITVALEPLAAAIPRFELYRTRLTAALTRIEGGDSGAFARPMNDSYHDIWMELHQDLLMVCGRERGTHDEG